MADMDKASEAFPGRAVSPTKDGSILEIGLESRHAMETEHRMGFFEGLKLYPSAVAWSMFFSLGIIMTAFDPQLLGSLYATPAFQRDFGYLYQGNYVSPSALYLWSPFF